jgi:GT2 family glycosyltransferase
MIGETAIAILSFNRLHCLKETVLGVQHYCRSAKIAIFDDGSENDVVQHLLDDSERLGYSAPLNADVYRRDNIDIYIGTDNLGVAGNSNRALHWFVTQTECEFLCLLNDDLHVLGPFHEMYKAAHEKLGVGLFCFTDFTHDNSYIPTLREVNGLRVKVLARLTGIMLAMTRTLVNTIGYFDMRFGYFGEEHCDYTYRAREAGFIDLEGSPCLGVDVCAADSVLRHQVCETSTSGPSRAFDDHYALTEMSRVYPTHYTKPAQFQTFELRVSDEVLAARPRVQTRTRPSIIYPPVPELLTRTLRQFQEDSGSYNAILIGGAVIDSLVSPNVEPFDWDFVIPSQDEKTISSTCENLASAGYRLGPLRDYALNRSSVATCLVARSPAGKRVDLAFTNGVGFVGPFNLEAVYLDRSAVRYVDSFGSIEAMVSGRILLARMPLYDEIPLTLVKRFILLCAKYGLRFGSKAANSEIAQLLRYLVEAEKALDAAQIAAVVAKLISGLSRATMPVELLNDLSESRLFDVSIPPLAALLRKERVRSAAARKGGITDMRSEMIEADSEGLLAETWKQLGLRHWDNENI